MRQFEQQLGVVENIDKTSRQLKEALESGKTIIVTTIQKFPVIAKEIGELPGKRFAVVVDEAHSSQSGESTKPLKAILATKDLDEAEREDADSESGPESGEADVDNLALAEAVKRGHVPNLSLFAFTATPKPKTLELFGAKRAEGKFAPFHLYSMRQAIEEGFILDVLANYATYKAYWRLLKKIEDDPRYDKKKAEYLLKSFVELHPHAIGEKVKICVEHFASKVQGEIGGKAKAMIVTRSRLHAVRYKMAVDQYLTERGYPFKALVAFSGTVKDGGKDYTESKMNSEGESQTISEAQTAKTFEQPEYRFLIVANKFQTGFDQPLLHTMYVDKKLGGVQAYRAAAVLGWCAAVDVIHKKIAKVGFDKFNVASSQMASAQKGRFKKFSSPQNVNSLSELRTVFDTVVLWILEGMGLIDSNQHTRLRSCFDLRNQGGHPAEAPITEYNLMSFFSDINQIVFRNSAFQ